jgi:hypothetical protein
MNMLNSTRLYVPPRAGTSELLYARQYGERELLRRLGPTPHLTPPDEAE